MYTWINHHIEAGDGPPTFFITLSCAEYIWPDIKRLLADRFHVTGLDSPELDKSLVQIVNDYTLVVQEYFQQRVRIWLSTIDTSVFHWPLVTHPFFWWVTGGPSIISQYLINLASQSFCNICDWIVKLQVPT